MKKINLLVCLLLIASVSMFGQTVKKKILVIGDTAATYPRGISAKIFADSLRKMTDCEVTRVVSGPTFKAMAVDTVKKFDIVFCTEEPGSGDPAAYGITAADGVATTAAMKFPVPAVWCKLYSCTDASGRWGWFNQPVAGDSSSWYIGNTLLVTAIANGVGDSTRIDKFPWTIKKDHEVFGKKYKVGQEVKWANSGTKAGYNGGGANVFMQAFKITKVGVTENTTELAVFSPKPDMACMAAVEACAATNNNRVFLLSTHSYAAFAMNPDFWWVARNAVRWALKIPVQEYKTAISETSVSNVALSSYPNPAKGSTNINFSLKQASDVNISVYSVTGQLVDVVMNQKLQAGSQSYTYNTSKLSAGTYFCKLNSGTSTSTMRMIITK